MESVEPLLHEFGRMVRRQGGSLSLLGVDGNLVRIGYRSGVDPACTNGVCVMPHLELQQLINETLAHRKSLLTVHVVPLDEPAKGST